MPCKRHMRFAINGSVHAQKAFHTLKKCICMPQRLTPTVFDPQKDIHLSSGLVANTYIFQYAGAIPALCAHAGGRCAASPGHPGGGS